MIFSQDDENKRTIFDMIVLFQSGISFLINILFFIFYCFLKKKKLINFQLSGEIQQWKIIITLMISNLLIQMCQFLFLLENDIIFLQIQIICQLQALLKQIGTMTFYLAFSLLSSQTLRYFTTINELKPIYQIKTKFVILVAIVLSCLTAIVPQIFGIYTPMSKTKSICDISNNGQVENYFFVILHYIIYIIIFSYNIFILCHLIKLYNNNKKKIQEQDRNSSGNIQFDNNSRLLEEQYEHEKINQNKFNSKRLLLFIIYNIVVCFFIVYKVFIDSFKFSGQYESDFYLHFEAVDEIIMGMYTALFFGIILYQKAKNKYKVQEQVQRARIESEIVNNSKIQSIKNNSIQISKCKQVFASDDTEIQTSGGEQYLMRSRSSINGCNDNIVIIKKEKSFMCVQDQNQDQYLLQDNENYEEFKN